MLEIKGKDYHEIVDILNAIKLDRKSAKDIVEIFIKNNLLLTTHAFEYILKNKFYEKGLENILKIAKDNEAKIITKEFIEFVVELENKNSQSSAVKEEKKEVIEKQIKEKKHSIKNFKILDYEIISNGKISDFVSYFQNRYKVLSSIIKKRIEYNDVIEICKINEGEDVCVIGMITDKENRAYGVTLTIEDLTGSIKVIFDRNKVSPDTEKILNNLVHDEVIGIKGRVAKNSKTIYGWDVVEPDVPYDFIPNKTDEEIYVVFLSDLHIGSILFLQKEFENFVEWINLKGNRTDIAEKVKYILIAGDVVDGVGVYPEQEKELALSDIYKQYDFAAELISAIPEDIEIIISPGNHDAVRIAKPQPEISKKFASKFYEMKNVHLVKNPAYVNIEGVNILIYHGESLDSLIRSIPGLSYSSPERGMREFLKKRHLSPIYSDIFPSEEDNLVIKNIPDIIHCGHVHAIGYDNYRNVYLINSGCFQGRTKYQEEMGHIPTPSKVPVMNLKTRSITILHFGES